MGWLASLVNKIALSGLLFSCAAMAQVEAKSCRILMEAIFSGNHPELRRINEILIAETDALLVRLPVAQRERILETIHGREILWDFDITHGGPAGGAVTVEVKFPQLVSLRLSFPAAVLKHPFGRIAFFHELKHLENLTSKGGHPHFAGFFARGFSNRGMLDEERSAFTAQYRLTRKLYTEFDLPRLQREYPSREDPALVAELQRRGVLSIEKGTRQIHISPELLKKLNENQEPELYRLLQRYAEDALNAKFVESVKRAVTMSEEDFVNFHVDKYQMQQTVLNSFRNKVAGTAVAGMASAVAGLYYALTVLGFVP
ncbi:MAG TPA: hypothetical protein VM901_09085 [Bdellovibrionota bacterium]|jgi:hypothetical protein|nr:hypothetical protein [Bdellovibrionota bacterium]